MPQQGAEGRDAVLAMYRDSTRRYPDGRPHTRHLVSNAILEVNDDGRTASARSCYTVLQRVGDLPLQPIIAGRYEDPFHRPDGRWWFDTRVMRVDLLGDLSRHLLFELG